MKGRNEGVRKCTSGEENDWKEEGIWVRKLYIVNGMNKNRGMKEGNNI